MEARRVAPQAEPRQAGRGVDLHPRCDDIIRFHLHQVDGVPPEGGSLAGARPPAEAPAGGAAGRGPPQGPGRGHLRHHDGTWCERRQ